MTTLVIDIETIPSGDMPERAKAPGQMKKAETIEAFETNPANILKEYRKRSLDSLEGQILSIAYKINDGETKCIISADESKVLKAFEEVLINTYNNEPIRWIGHNVKSFDIPFIFHRSLKNGLDKLRFYLPKYDQIYDTMLNFNPYDYKYRISLNKACEFLGIEQSKNGVQGSNVYDYFQEGKLEEIAQYNIEDVDNTYEIYKRLCRI